MPEEAVLEMKLNYSLPSESDPHVDEIMWVELPRDKSEGLVQMSVSTGFYVCCTTVIIAFSALFGRQEGHTTCKKNLEKFSFGVLSLHFFTFFTLLHFAWKRANHYGGTCSQLMSQVGGGKTGNRLPWSIPL